MDNGLKEILDCMPTATTGIDWAKLEKSALVPFFSGMKGTPQNPLHHGEGDVYTHTQAVCENLVRLPAYRSMKKRDREILFVAALLHDIGKIRCTKEEDGVIVSPHHAAVGAMMARTFLWRDLLLCGDTENQGFRESVCLLIRYHSFPPYALERDERYFLRIAANGELAKGFSLRKLCLLEEADVLGRISADNEQWLENIACTLLLSEEYECADIPFPFASAFAQRAYFREKTDWRYQDIYDDTWGEVILMAGLPGTGKDTYIRTHYGDLPMISLDEFRLKMGISPTDHQGAVIAAAREAAKVYLRKKQPFIWNATDISEQIRSNQISLFEDYGAGVRTVFLETEWTEGLRRNAERKAVVPPHVIERLLQKLQIPERSECQCVEWKIV